MAEAFGIPSTSGNRQLCRDGVRHVRLENKKSTREDFQVCKQKGKTSESISRRNSISCRQMGCQSIK